MTAIEIAPDEVWYPELDDSRDQIALFVGRKGSGKSKAAREFFRQWPGVDKLVVDVNKDADPGDDLAPTVLPVEVPHELPERRHPDVPETYRWMASPLRDTFRADLDRVLGLALHPQLRRILLWVDEAGVVFKVQQVGRAGRTLLHQNRHYHASMLLCCPRPIDIDPLCISQADRIHMWDVPNPRDRQRIADNIGYPPRVVDEALRYVAEQGKHWSLLYVADPDTRGLYAVPPLPLT